MSIVGPVLTLSMKVVEYMNNMPDDVKSKKEIESYFKEVMKKSLENNKPEKVPNVYQTFMKENIKVVKKEHPNLTGPEVFSRIASMWRKQKEGKDNAGDVNEVKDVNDVNDVNDVKEVKEVKDVKEVKNVNVVNDVKDVKEVKDVKDVNVVKEVMDVNVVKEKRKKVK